MPRAVGRPRKPHDVKLLTGSRSNMRTSANEVKPATILQDPPYPLPPLAQTYWDRRRIDGYWLGSADAEKLALYSIWAATAEEMVREIEKTGLYIRKNGWTKTITFKNGKKTVITFDGVRVRSPAEEILYRATQMVDKLGSELGFSPTSRTRIYVPGQTPQSSGGPGGGAPPPKGNRFAANAAAR